MATFSELGLHPEVMDALVKQRIYEPTPVQVKTIPAMLDGSDVIAQAPTGTGKTLAFLLPMLQNVNPDVQAMQALVVTPTRELAVQIAHEAGKITPFLSGVHAAAVYGGQDLEKQVKQMKRGAQVVIGTPGRLLDHLRRGTMDLSRVSMLVLDEADQMLQLGFLEDVEAILMQLPADKQITLFSATMPAPIRAIAKRYMRAPRDIRVKHKHITVDDVTQQVVETTDRTKQDTLCSLIDDQRPYLAIIFCRTKRRAKTLTEVLQTRGYLADELHGDLSQTKREQVIQRFKSAEIQLLVATDVAARGLDVEGVTHVFNYDIPHDVESYIHRIGRTGRAGETGMAITLVAPKDRPFLAMIEKGIGQTLDKDNSYRQGNGASPGTNASGTAGRHHEHAHGGERRPAFNGGGRSGPGERHGKGTAKRRPKQIGQGRRRAGKKR